LDVGLIARVRDPHDGRRRIYLPRQPALELISTLVGLMEWGDANTAAEAPFVVPPAGLARDSLVASLIADAETRLAD